MSAHIVLAKRLVTETFFSVLDDGDLLYMNASAQCLQKIDTVYHEVYYQLWSFDPSLWSVFSCGTVFFVHRRLGHRFTFIYKAMLGLLPPTSGTLSQRRLVLTACVQTLLLTVPFARTELERNALTHSAPATWNKLQKDWSHLFEGIKSRRRGFETDSLNWNCFLSFGVLCIVIFLL